MPVDPRTPCLIGGGQATWHGPELAPEPLAMWEQVARAAADDTGADATAVLNAVDSVQVVFCQSWPYDDPPGRLADRVGARPGGHRRSSGIGGTTPQVLVADTCDRIIAGELDLALIAGGEALYTKRQLKKRGERPDWSHRAPDKRRFPMEQMPPQTEIAHQVFQAYLTFALFDSARRGHLGIDLDDYRRRLGAELAAMTDVAADNPHAWFPTRRSADELITPTDDNRMVAYPYTKHMVSVMDVDTAGALLLASEATADALGVPREQRIYPRGWAYAEDPWVVAAHAQMWRSPAMAAAGNAALDMAGVTIDDVAHLDLYSCFTSSVLFARDALGIGDDRPATVTGGLPFFGGAGSAYMVQSIAELADRLRHDPGSVGLASGVGMHMTKHAYGVYATEPPAAPPTPVDGAALQARLDAEHAPATVVDAHTGPAAVAAYTVLHARDGAPERGVAVCDLPDGTRCYAQIDDTGLLDEIEQRELVGQTVEVVAGDGINVIKG